MTEWPATDEPMTDGPLTKVALVEQVAHAADLTKKRAEIIIDTVFGSIAEALHQGEKVELRGFGSFRLRRREPHRGHNPISVRPSTTGRSRLQRTWRLMPRTTWRGAVHGRLRQPGRFQFRKRGNTRALRTRNSK